MSAITLINEDYINNDKALFKKKSENQNYISFDNSLKINGNLYIGGLTPATTTFKLKFPQNGEKVGFYFGLNETSQGHVLNMDLENTDESIKAFCDKINGLGNRFNPDDCFIPGNGTLEASFERFSETDVNLSLSLYTTKQMQYGNGMYLYAGEHWQTHEPQFAPWDNTVLPEGPRLSGGGTPTNYSLTVNGSPLKEFKSIEENTSGVHIANNFDISNSSKQTLLSVNDTGVVIGKGGAISTIVDIGSYQYVSSMRITSGTKHLSYQQMDLKQGIDHIVGVINGTAAQTPLETYGNFFKVSARKLSSTRFSIMFLDEGLDVDDFSGKIGEDLGPETPLTFTKETPNFSMRVNGQLYDKNGREIVGGGGSGGGNWYEHNSGSEVFIGPGYGNTPSDSDNLVLGVKNDGPDSNAFISIGSNIEIWSCAANSNVLIRADAPESNMHLEANDTIYIGPEMGGIKVYSDGQTQFNNTVKDKNGDEILGGAGPLYNYDGSRVWIGPNEAYNNLSGFSVEAGSYNYGKYEYINAGDGELYLYGGTNVYIGPNTNNQKTDNVIIDVGNNFTVTKSNNYNQREYINAGSDNDLYLHAGTDIYIGPNTNGDKAGEVTIDVEDKITLTVDGLSLELDKTKLQKLIDKLAE